MGSVMEGQKIGLGRILDDAPSGRQMAEWMEEGRSSAAKRVAGFRTRTGCELTLDQYRNLLIRSRRKCECCGRPVRGRSEHIDHCHKTNRVRGILCPGCNTKLGVLENIEWVKKGISYLKRVAGENPLAPGSRSPILPSVEPGVPKNAADHPWNIARKRDVVAKMKRWGRA